MADREKLIELLNTALGDADITRYELLLIADYLVDNGVTVQRWIPVTERLPDEKGEYLVAFHPCYWKEVDTKVTFVGTDTFRGKTSWAKKKYQRVTHWMPLPEPLKEGDHEPGT